MVIETNYQAFDEDMGETFEISLLDIHECNLTSVNITMICLYAIYTTYQTSKNKEKYICEALLQSLVNTGLKLEYSSFFVRNLSFLKLLEFLKTKNND